MEQHVFLIGARASGKTTLGRELARELNEGFTDTDAIVVERIGMAVEKYVEQNGWAAFRRAESQALRDAADQPPHIVACGGGIVLSRTNRDILQQGVVVYLRVPEEELIRRLENDPKSGQRPSLTGRGLVEEVREVLGEREPLYCSCASLTVEHGTLAQQVRVVQDFLSSSMG